MSGPYGRRSPRLRGFDYTREGGYFITVCARGRARSFGDVAGDEVRLSPLGVIVRRCWLEIPNHHPGVELDLLVVMPNHIHGILFLEDVGAGYIPPLHQVVGTFKAAVSRAAGAPVWQRSFFDRVIRSEEELRALRRYTAENPLRWALARPNRP